VSRAAVLVFLIDLAAHDRDPADDLDLLRAELNAYDPELAGRPTIVVAAKVDVGRDRLDEVLARVPGALPISSVTGEGIDQLVERMSEGVRRARSGAPAAPGYVRHVVRDDPLRVQREGDAWRVSGKRPERAVAATDMNNDEAVARLQRRLISMGVERLLEEAGARTGDEVRIGEAAFDFEPEATAPG
jgi:GTP-binding protein